MLTPQIVAPQLANLLGLTVDLYLKREDLNPYGSHKGRSIPFMIDYYIQQGWKNFCVSSSGSAALAAAWHIKKLGLWLDIFVGMRIIEEKLKKLKDSVVENKITVQQVINPRQRAMLLEKNGQAKNLRQSTDDLALAGYEELAKELAEIKNLSAVFVPTSSGTTAQGLYWGFKKHGLNPQIHIIQTSYCHPLATAIEGDVFKSAPESLADSVVDNVAHRRLAVAKAVKDSGGRAWVATDQELTDMRSLLLTSTSSLAEPKISFNGLLPLVGLQQAAKAGCKFSGPVVCLVGGQ